MKITTKRIAAAAVIGALYTALTLLLAPISFGVLQFRVSEALCILPALVPGASWGLWVGCALSNLLGGYGVPDIVFGSLATLLSSLCIERIARGEQPPFSFAKTALICLMPVVWNGPVVGAVIAYGTGVQSVSGYLLFMCQIAAEEACVMLTAGLALLKLLPRSKPLMELMRS